MNETEKTLIQAAQTIDPTAPIVEAASAAIETVANPSPENILADLELAISLVKQFRAAMANLHPSVINIVKELF